MQLALEQKTLSTGFEFMQHDLKEAIENKTLFRVLLVCYIFGLLILHFSRNKKKEKGRKRQEGF